MLVHASGMLVHASRALVRSKYCVGSCKQHIVSMLAASWLEASTVLVYPSSLLVQRTHCVGSCKRRFVRSKRCCFKQAACYFGASHMLVHASTAWFRAVLNGL